MVARLVWQFEQIQSEWVDAFLMECSTADIKTNPEAKKLAKYINRQGKRIDRIIKLIKKLI